MATLVLGPLLRHVDDTSATIWVETDRACTVTVSDASAATFRVGVRHYALVVLSGLAPGTSIEYRVCLDDEQVWPLPDSTFPPSRIRTLDSAGDTRFRMVFGSCRLPPATSDKERRTLGVDALRAYAVRMTGQAPEQWPDALLLLGDQVYADELSEATAGWLRDRRNREGTGADNPPGEVRDFEDYVRLYHETWSEPYTRWLLSTVPTSMIFDDHDVRDDWNTSQAWREEMAATPWWADRIRAALGSYWVYQHIGNLDPAELADDPIYPAMTGGEPDEDMAGVLHDFAAGADEEVNGAKRMRWSYRRDFGRVRLLVVDTRSGRILAGGNRSMLSDGEFRWIEDNAHGEFEHLLLGSSLPWLMAPALSDVQSWNEALCRRPGRRGRVGEWLRQALDLEHWASFRASFDRLGRLLIRVARGEAGTEPATVLVLSGDVHHAYAAQANYPGDAGAGVYQLTCSPVHNAVPGPMKLVFRLGWRALPARIARALARGMGVTDPELSWGRLSGPHFDNAVATVELTGRTASMTLEAATEDGGRPVLSARPAVRLTHEATR